MGNIILCLSVFLRQMNWVDWVQAVSVGKMIENKREGLQAPDQQTQPLQDLFLVLGFDINEASAFF